ncbi:MAG: glycosyltransferase WbuB, partial [Acidimicrobiaceae bacterium]
ILAVGKPVIAAIDEGSAVARLLADANAGVSIPPDDVGALLDAVDALVGDRKRCRELGAHGPQWVADHASPVAASLAYEKVLAGEQTG